MSNKAKPEYLPSNIFFNKAKEAGFPLDNLARFLAYTATATELNLNYSKRVKYSTDPPVQVLYAGVLGLPIVSGLGISRKMAEDPGTCMACAYKISHAGTGFGYLPPLDLEVLADNKKQSQGEYAVWLSLIRHGKEWD